MCNPCETRGYIDYTILFYCVFGDSPAIGYIFFALWLIVLFYLLGNTASEYFCSSLEGLSRALNLSPTIAGVTLLSLGNGAPDVFATVVSFAQGGGDGSAVEIGLSSVLGGAFFVSSSVLGVIGICIGFWSRPMVAVHRLSFVRDLCFLLAALCFLLLILFLGRIHVLGAMGFVCLYIVYVIVVSMTQCCRKEVGEVGVPLLESVEVVQHQANVNELPSEPILFNSVEGVSSFSSCSLFLSLIELPLHLPRRLTIPVVEEKRWSKPFAVASVVLSPLSLATLWNSKTGDMCSEQSTAIFFFAALLGIVLGIFAMECTEEYHPQKLFSFHGLLVAFS
ncbi:hypothetical protein HPP92_017657 [Vanilla planifolia]|uniref:Sodium/calcium exchanger membrane region domain-containing protein n=1 Tax=Vanilla planifolia TaxID=51239 RepID=A0A835QE39_VANPL|nr:hypothetical protein HPP92_017657 [Vanilla planifolia]